MDPRMHPPRGTEAEASVQMTRRLSTRAFVYLLIGLFVLLTLLGLIFGLPLGGASPTNGHLPAL